MTLAPFSTEAVLLAQIAYGEADRIVTLFTRARGKVTAMAHGARKSRSRFGAALSLFVLGDATLRARRGGDLYTLERFEARRVFSHLETDLVALAHASYATELARELSAAEKPDEPVLSLLLELYQTVETYGPRADTLRAFELRLLGELGLAPGFDRCVGCGSRETAKLDGVGALLDPHGGGVLCSACPRPGARPLGTAVRMRLCEVQTAASLALAAQLPPAPRAVALATREATRDLLSNHLVRPLRTVAFLEQL